MISPTAPSKSFGELVHVEFALYRDALLGVLLLFAIEAELGLHRLDVSQRDADLVVAFDGDAAVEFALRDFRHHTVELLERPADGADGLEAKPAAKQQPGQQKTNSKAHDHGVLTLSRIVFRLGFLDLDRDQLVQILLRRSEQLPALPARSASASSYLRSASSASAGLMAFST